MDDFIILAKTKAECINIKFKIEQFLKMYLNLSLNNKSKYYPYSMGVNFCGYRIFTTHKLLRLNSKKKIKKKIKHWNKLYEKNLLNISKVTQCINSWLGHSSHCNSYTLQRKILNSCNFFYNNNFYKKIEEDLITLINKDNIKNK